MPIITIPYSSLHSLMLSFTTMIFLKLSPILFNDLVLSCQLWTYLTDINEQAQARLQTIIGQMQKAESVTEKMKADNQCEWIQRMGSIHNRAEEIVLNELIYR